ncbi:MAG: hypothetical protein M0031_04085 [Thermaerobacter sp.]|nr:hypothetical protein [Thermaerobacter sp.]
MRPAILHLWTRPDDPLARELLAPGDCVLLLGEAVAAAGPFPGEVFAAAADVRERGLQVPWTLAEYRQLPELLFRWERVLCW